MTVRLALLAALWLAAPALRAALVTQAAPAPPAVAAQPQTAPLQTASPAPTLPFSRLPFDEARAAANEQGRIFIVEATSPWSGASRTMERDVWTAPAVVAWLGGHAVAVQVDVELDKLLARQLEAKETPTIIVWRGDEELDRHQGALDASDLIAWLGDVAAGGDGTGPLLFRGLKLLHSDDVEARYDVARDLLYHQQDELALQHFLWLWPNTRRVSALGGVRISFMLSNMADLAQRDEDARDAFAEIDAEVCAAVAGKPSPNIDAWQEFTSWCQFFDHEEDVIAWYEAQRAPDGSLACDHATDTLLEVLVKRGRWADAGRLGHLVARATIAIRTQGFLEQSLKLAGRGDMAAELKGFEAQQLRIGLCRMAAAAWAADQPDDGREIAGKLLAELDDVPTRLSLVELTLQAAGPLPEQVAWLDEAAAKGADADEVTRLREQLASAVGAAPPGIAAPVEPAAPPEPLR